MKTAAYHEALQGLPSYGEDCPDLQVEIADSTLYLPLEHRIGMIAALQSKEIAELPVAERLNRGMEVGEILAGLMRRLNRQDRDVQVVRMHYDYTIDDTFEPVAQKFVVPHYQRGMPLFEPDVTADGVAIGALRISVDDIEGNELSRRGLPVPDIEMCLGRPTRDYIRINDY